MGKELRTVCFDKDLQIEAYWFKGLMQKFPNHFHEHYVIGFIENGQRHLSCKNKEYTIDQGDMVLFNPLDNHTCEQINEKTLDYRCINIKSEVMKKAVLEITGQEYMPYFTQAVVFHSEQIELLRELHIAIMEEQTDFKKEETFIFLMEQLIEEYTQSYSQMEAVKMDTGIQAVRDYLDQHYADRINLDQLSEISDMNKYSLLRAFTKLLGITPYRYLETVRINNAKKLLESGVEPIEAAMQTGFVDQSHFTNFFKEFIGLTPKQYQNIFIITERKL